MDEAGMIGSRSLARLITQAGEAGAKIVLVGDPEQLQAIEAGAAFRAIADHVGTANLTEIRRQQEGWQREATAELATGRTAAALERYRAAGAILAADTDEVAQARLVAAWAASRAARPAASRIMLAHTRDNVRALNEAARAELAASGELGEDVTLATSRGDRHFAAGDRLLFLQNDRGLGVKNGTLGTVEAIGRGQLQVRADDGRAIVLDPTAYQQFDHGYAVTIHKAQGVTVDEAYVLASRGFDRHLAYVSMSRHRDRLTLVHSREAFEGDAELAQVLGRERAKDTTLDYAEDMVPQPLAPPTLDMPAPRPTAAFIAQHQLLQPQVRQLGQDKVQDSPEVSSVPSEVNEQLTDIERAFIQQRNAAPTLEQAFRLRRDRGPRLGR